MDFDAYAKQDALNWSSLKLMADSPLLYRFRQDHPRPDSAALSLGRAIHCAILEPDAFASRYLVRPDGLDGRTKDGKAWIADARERGLEVIGNDDAQVIARCIDAVKANPVARAALDGTDREVSLSWEVGGVACKGRPDAVDRQSVIDLKTTRDLGRFPCDYESLRYYGQLAWYLDGAIRAGVCDSDATAYIIAVETSEPYDCACYALTSEAIDSGRRLYRRLLELWRSCRDSDRWPGRVPGLGYLDVPRWEVE